MNRRKLAMARAAWRTKPIRTVPAQSFFADGGRALFVSRAMHSEILKRIGRDTKFESWLAGVKVCVSPACESYVANLPRPTAWATRWLRKMGVHH